MVLMTSILVFIGLQILASGYAQLRGGAPEKAAGILLFGAMTITLWADAGGPTYRGIQWGLLSIDAGLFMALSALAVCADRFWPIYLASCQLVAVGAHGASAYNPDVMPLAYWWLVGKMSYPMVIILILGTLRHERRKRHGSDEFGWTAVRQRAHAGSRGQHERP